MENPENQLTFQQELLEQLRASYEARNQEIAKGFTQALTSVQTSEVLQVMKGAEMLPWCLQHIEEITAQILNSDAEQSLKQSLRTTSELKAQMAILRMELQLAKKKQNSDKRSKQLEQEVELLKSELSLEKQKSASLKLAEIVQKQIQSKIKIIEKEYILKAEHERIVQDLQRQIRQTQRAEAKSPSKHQESQELLKKILTEKYQQTLRRQSEKYQAEIDLLKGRIKLLQKDISLNSHSRHQISHGLIRVLSNSDLRKENKIEKLIDSEKEEKQAPIKLSEHLPAKDNNTSIMKLASPIRGSLQNPLNSSQRNLSKVLQPSDKSQMIKHTFDRQKSSTKFEDIQASFAKQLSELRQRMSLKRQRLGSPDLLHNRIRTTLRDDSSRRRLYGSPSEHLYQGYSKN